VATDKLTTREIARQEWPDFFDEFSREHEGWSVTIERLDPALGDQIEVENHAFQGIVAERKGEPKVIEIFAGSTAKESSTHVIQNPARVWIEEAGENAGVAVEIESEDRVKTLLRFQSEGAGSGR
jgi:uncharacterized protein DUF5335